MKFAILSTPFGVGLSNYEFDAKVQVWWPLEGLHKRDKRDKLTHNVLTFCFPAHTWVTSDDTISTEVCMEPGPSVSGH